jgi:hypothetical protein
LPTIARRVVWATSWLAVYQSRIRTTEAAGSITWK